MGRPLRRWANSLAQKNFGRCVDNESICGYESYLASSADPPEESTLQSA